MLLIVQNCPLTNAGTGSNLNLAGDVECDASIMDGETNHFGAVAALQGMFYHSFLFFESLHDEQQYNIYLLLQSFRSVILDLSQMRVVTGNY